MATAPTLVAVAEIEGTGATLTTPTSVSWQTNDVVIALCGAEASGTFGTPTTGGSGISFGTSQQRHNSTGSDCAGVGFACVASAGSSGTFAVTNPVSGSRCLLGVYIFRSSAGIGNSNISTGSSRTVSLTLAGVDGAVCWIVLDYHADATQSFTPAATSHGTSAPGPQASPLSQAMGVAYTYYLGELDDQTSGTGVPYGIGGSNSGPFTIIAIEAQASGVTPQSATVTLLPVQADVTIT